MASVKCSCALAGAVFLSGGSNFMSHIVSIQSRLHDPAAIASACQRLGLAVPTAGTAELFSGTAEGLLLHLPGWRYPAVIDVLTGTVRYDVYEGSWGEEAKLHRFLQMYAVEKAKAEARKRGLQVQEQALADGSIKLEILEGT
jgi:hypothetical protein